jgi:hypothetical protein
MGALGLAPGYGAEEGASGGCESGRHGERVSDKQQGYHDSSAEDGHEFPFGIEKMLALPRDAIGVR